MAVKAFLDTNILVYAYSDDASRNDRALEIVRQGGVVSVQVLNELVDVLRRKMRFDWAEVATILADLRRAIGEPIALTDGIHRDGVAVAERFGLRIYDSMIVSAAKSAGCSVLYTEDLRHGQVIDGVRVENPFLVP